MIFRGVSDRFGLTEIPKAWISASHQESSKDFAQDFASLHSNLALSVIGSMTRPLPNLEEATWNNILVAKVPIVAL